VDVQGAANELRKAFDLSEIDDVQFYGGRLAAVLRRLGRNSDAEIISRRVTERLKEINLKGDQGK